MTITSASYKEKFPTFQFCNCDIGFEGSLGENENPLIALKQLRELAIAFHKQEFPHLYIDGMDAHIQRQNESDVIAKSAFNIQPKSEEQITREQQIEGYYEIIRMAGTPEQLKKHWGNIERLQDLELVNAYNKKLNLFENQK